MSASPSDLFPTPPSLAVTGNNNNDAATEDVAMATNMATPTGINAAMPTPETPRRDAAAHTDPECPGAPVKKKRARRDYNNDNIVIPALVLPPLPQSHQQTTEGPPTAPSSPCGPQQQKEEEEEDNVQCAQAEQAPAATGGPSSPTKRVLRRSYTMGYKPDANPQKQTSGCPCGGLFCRNRNRFLQQRSNGAANGGARPSTLPGIYRVPRVSNEQHVDALTAVIGVQEKRIRELMQQKEQLHAQIARAEDENKKLQKDVSKANQEYYYVKGRSEAFHQALLDTTGQIVEASLNRAVGSTEDDAANARDVDNDD